MARARACVASSGRTTVLDVVTDERAYPPISSFNDNAALSY
jgi:acetolactate synthase-1/2/3 large subunit